MKRYTITERTSSWCSYEVDAESEDEALEITSYIDDPSSLTGYRLIEETCEERYVTDEEDI